MNHTPVRIFSLFLVGIFLGTLPALAQTKRALIVAIGSYSQRSGWPTISSANDVPLIRAALEYQKFGQVTVVTDEKATKQSIIRAFETLIEQCKPADQVVIHFSSHGQQISDDSDDELDGFDEAIVCYDAPVRPQLRPDYNGSEHLRDDELNGLIERLRTKLGANGDILLVADACHSGTLSRGGIARVRGNSQPYALPGKTPKTVSANAPEQARPFLAPDRSGKSVSRGSETGGKAPYVIISAAKAGELNYEYLLPDGSLKGVGSLSFALNKALRAVGPNDTYRTLFNRVVSEMKLVAPQQTPEIDGDYDRELFGGKAVHQALYYPVQSLSEGGRQLIIGAGRLETVNVGALVRVCPENTPDPMRATSFVSGTVVDAGLFSATVQLTKPVAANPKSWVFITERSYGDMSLSVSLDSLRAGPLRTSAEGALRALPLVKFTPPNRAELYLSQRDSIGRTFVYVRKTGDGFVVGDPILASMPAQIRERLEDYAQGRFLQSFESDNEDIQLTIDLKPVKPGGKTSDTLRQADYIHNGLLQFANVSPRLSDSAVVVVTNTGRLTVFYSIIDIQPDGIVNVLFPMSENPQANGRIIRDYPANYQLKPGERQVIRNKVGFAPPFGKETFKVLASTEEFDLRHVLNMRSRGEGATRGLNKAIEQMFGTAQVLTRGGGTSGLPSSNAPIGTFNFPFKIVRARLP